MLSHAEIANRQEVLSLEEILVLLQRFYEIFYAFLKIIKFELFLSLVQGFVVFFYLLYISLDLSVRGVKVRVVFV